MSHTYAYNAYSQERELQPEDGSAHEAEDDKPQAQAVSSTPKGGLHSFGWSADFEMWLDRLQLVTAALETDSPSIYTPQSVTGDAKLALRALDSWRSEGSVPDASEQQVTANDLLEVNPQILDDARSICYQKLAHLSDDFVSARYA